jgi:hypothetical protein
MYHFEIESLMLIEKGNQKETEGDFRQVLGLQPLRFYLFLIAFSSKTA